MPPDLLEPFLCLNQLQISSAETNTLEKNVEIMPPPHSKFLATPLLKDESDRCSLGPHGSNSLGPLIV